jgi:hypothetical protein
MESSDLTDAERQSGLRLDGEGRWWHEGQPVLHAGLARALHRWLDQLPDGRFVVRLDAERYAVVEVEDAPYQVLTVEIERGKAGARVHLHLSDGTEEELRYDSLRVGAGNALYCRVKDRFAARLSRSSVHLLGELIEEHEAGFALRAAGKVWPIADGAVLP